MFLGKYQYRRQRKVTRSFDKDTSQCVQPFRPTGQYSAGSTCFVNSCVQMLSSSPSFERYLRRVLPLVRTEQLPTSLLQQCCGKVANIHDFNNIMGEAHRYYYDRQQHDSQAFMQCVQGDMETLVENAVKNMKVHEEGSSKRSVADNSYIPPYSCKEQSSRVCYTCHQTTTHTQSLSIISQSMFNVANLTLETLFQQYSMREQIDDARCEYCTITKTQALIDKEIASQEKKQRDTKVKVQSTGYDDFVIAQLRGKKAVEKAQESVASRLLRVKREAKLLVKQQHEEYPNSPFKAREYGVDVEDAYFMLTKNLSRVVPVQVARGKSERTLKVKDFNESLMFHFKQLQNNRNKVLCRASFPLSFSLKDLDPGVTDDKRRYRLASAVVHVGNAYGGHYYTYRRAGVVSADEAARRNRVYSRGQPLYGSFECVEADHVQLQGPCMQGDSMLEGNRVFLPDIRQSSQLSNQHKPSYTWFRCSDLDITQVSEEEVLAAQPYMLLYEQE